MRPASDRGRPRVHFTARAGWINDPLGLTWHDGQYHLFFQYLPHRTSWELDCRWGHAISPDLMHWEEQPVALAPGDGDDGIWSGSIVIDDQGTPNLFYTAVHRDTMALGVVRTATPTDPTWRSWVKGPMIVNPARNHDLITCRDPFVFREGDQWRMLIGAALPDGSAGALTYTSSDLTSWAPGGITASRPSTSREPVWTGSLWECPQLMRFPAGDALIVSVWHDEQLHDVVYAVGAYEDGRFAAATWRRLTVGDGLYAASSFRDRDGYQCLTFWIRGAGDGLTWAGAISTSYRVELRPRGLTLTPHPTLQETWTRSLHLQAGLRHHTGPQSYIEWTASPGDRLDLSTPSGHPVARVTIHIDLLRIELSDHTEELLLSEGHPVRLIADGSVLEIATDRQLFARAIQPIEWVELTGNGVCHLPPPAPEVEPHATLGSQSSPQGPSY